MSCSLRYRLLLQSAVCISWLSPVLPATAWAEPPLLYRQPGYESPVVGEPGDLLLIAGYGLAADDEVIYQAIDAAPERMPHPASIPAQRTATLGWADIVGVADIPYSVTVRLPDILRSGSPYALWVRTAAHEWSEPVFINDARPLWLSPSFVFASAELASLPRDLKIVGRNLQPADRSRTAVRLTGPVDLVLEAAPAAADAAALDRYVASVRLPDRMTPGNYRVRLTRDGTHWVDLTGQSLEVRPDPPPPAEFLVEAYGGCKADDSADASACVTRAIAAAAQQGGTVVFGPGNWHLSELRIPQPDGIVVPRGVNLRGSGTRMTTIIRDADGKSTPPTTVFTVLGANTVHDLTFRDAHLYAPAKWVGSSFFQVGPTHREGAPASVETAAAVQDVVFTKDAFFGTNVAIGAGGSPIERLLVTYNEFGAFRAAIELSANRFLVNERFAIQDSVIAHNTFQPGSYLDTAGRQGTMASELGAAKRLDFSDNTADGTAIDGLTSPTDPRGWRAGFFWHMNDNLEMMLVSANRESCTGDKDGDGEAISFDNNANTFALSRAGLVLGSGAGSVTVAGPLIHRQFDREILSGDYYVGHWIQVGEGPGLGQVRKIVSYRENAGDGSVTFQVKPDWDVVPAAARSRISIGREFWQVYTVANVIDQRKPLCEKSNRTGPKGGGISLWAQTADSVVDGNRQYDTDGIIFQQFYSAEDAACHDCRTASDYQDFLEIRGNLIDGEYAWDDDCSSSGIFGSLAASPTPRSPPPTVSYGVTIARNTINRADARGGGAITMMTTAAEGPAPHRWPLAANVLVYRNILTGLDAPPAKACKGGSAHARTGISLAGSHLFSHGVLFANVCPKARRPHDRLPADEMAVCEKNAPPSCECP